MGDCKTRDNLGFPFGLKLRALIWGGVVISLISITNAPLILKAGWFVGQKLEMGIAGLVVGAGLGTVKLRGLMVWMLLFVLSALIIAIILQYI